MPNTDIDPGTVMTLEFNEAKLACLRHAYHHALTNRLGSFTWDGQQFDTVFAGYLLSYLEGRIHAN